MVCASSAMGEYPAGCSKSPDFSPAQPWRAETRLVPSKAAASEGPRRNFLTRPPNCYCSSLPMGYVEGLNDARTKHGKKRVLARLGWAGETSDFFSILLVSVAERGSRLSWGPVCAS